MINQEILDSMSLSGNIVGKVKTRYSRCLYEFNLKMQDDSVHPFKIWFPTNDRRLAKRIARREHKKFSKHGRQYYFTI